MVLMRSMAESGIDLISTIPFNLRKGVRLQPYQMLWLEFRG